MREEKIATQAQNAWRLLSARGPRDGSSALAVQHRTGRMPLRNHCGAAKVNKRPGYIRSACPKHAASVDVCLDFQGAVVSYESQDTTVLSQVVTRQHFIVIVRYGSETGEDSSPVHLTSFSRL